MLPQQVRLCLQALHISINEFSTFVASRGLDDDVVASVTAEGDPRLQDTLAQLRQLCEIAEELANVLHEMRSPMQTAGSCSTVTSHQPLDMSQTTQECKNSNQDSPFESRSVDFGRDKSLENPPVPSVIQVLPRKLVQPISYPGDASLPAIGPILSNELPGAPPPINHAPCEKPSASCIEPLDQFAHCRILIAEDNMINQKVMLKFLRRLGLNDIVTASDGQAAVNIVQECMDRYQPFDLIFMDDTMPVLSGHDATHLIREMGFRGPICGMMVNLRLANKQKAFDAGITTIIHKPFQLRAIREVLEQYLTPLVEELDDTMLSGWVDDSPLPRRKPDIKSKL
ncbi:hypothetical protein COCC4DRAFT_37949 [Bipolaris maydis ATCC 48331]|uniref:Response regulatory domain-containing protein n=1 Tax=Cochliobolus heterostrophus (strain C4 / ATCC 48331 / race T) TaxID=665024 RepID=N4X5A7_COCH4|nr:uncharacterized protein COCC4DRAFT_37949 [Bipolaris maydis ATCC 48331]KAJ5022329.1 CheY-like superfamily [Bipolaris maydis]ENI08204.1 hypothetical protein COCC4DRAFT_37949 [Bipolaris maydis ATCC 48331]KAJ5061024.1 response regulator receiver REC1p [Bipolaris maydis]KAJ6198154.1 response regulator receiver REC1p [Bipolaris maydis]KAJ6272172.1 CheY-like superfamily [Bipolaris maydis]